MDIGRIVGSTDQTDYAIHVYVTGDVESPPNPAARGFGQFVGIPCDANTLVGVIYTTVLVNPAYGALGPRLSTEQELPIFSPDYLPETATVVGVVLVGTMRVDDGQVSYDQTTPTVASTIDATVRLLTEDEFMSFHFPDDRLRLAYFPRLQARSFPSLPDLLCTIIDRLAVARPGERERLEVARRNLRWRAMVGTRS